MRDEGVRNRTVLIFLNNCNPKANIIKAKPLKLLLILTMLLFSSVHLFSQSQGELDVKETALNYIEGWYSAYSARMASALSVDLVKLGFLHPRKEKSLRIHRRLSLYDFTDLATNSSLSRWFCDPVP